MAINPNVFRAAASDLDGFLGDDVYGRARDELFWDWGFRLFRRTRQAVVLALGFPQ
jgi:hypothetical protein